MNIETKVCKDLRGMSHIWRRPWPSCCPQPSSSVQCRCPARRPSQTSWTCWGCFSTVPSHRRYSSQCQDCSPLQYLRATLRIHLFINHMTSSIFVTSQSTVTLNILYLHFRSTFSMFPQASFVLGFELLILAFSSSFQPFVV